MANKQALVVGGSRGIGRAAVLKLAQLGFDITFSCRSESEDALSTRNQARESGIQCDIITFDLASRSETAEKLEEYFKHTVPDVIVYNAGITRDNLLAFMTPDEWDSVLRVNLDGFYNVIQPAIFHMLARKSGRIIAITSASGQTGQAGQMNYSASKAGLIGAVKSLAREVGRKNIYVNAVAPGVIETDMTKDLPVDKIKPLIPLARFGSVEEVAAVIGFLAAEEHMYIHGQVIGVNGGLVL